MPPSVGRSSPSGSQQTNCWAPWLRRLPGSSVETGLKRQLRELWVALRELKAMVVRDPGIRMAADDLYAAATALVAGERAGPNTVGVKHWRLLKEADVRLRERLASARPSQKTKLPGLH